MADDISSQLTVTEVFPAISRDRLYDYWTDQELLTAFWAHEAAVDVRVGGSYRLSWPAMGRTLRGEYLAVTPGERLEFTWAWDEEPEVPERIVAMAFAETDGGSTLTITHGTYGAGEAEAAERSGHREGWEYFCAVLRDAEATRPPGARPDPG